MMSKTKYEICNISDGKTNETNCTRYVSRFYHLITSVFRFIVSLYSHVLRYTRNNLIYLLNCYCSMYALHLYTFIKWNKSSWKLQKNILTLKNLLTWYCSFIPFFTNVVCYIYTLSASVRAVSTLTVGLIQHPFLVSFYLAFRGATYNISSSYDTFCSTSLAQVALMGDRASINTRKGREANTITILRISNCVSVLEQMSLCVLQLHFVLGKCHWSWTILVYEDTWNKILCSASVDS